MKGGQCIKITGCTNLLADGVCSLCAAGYFLDQGKCTICDASCKSCSDSSLCLSCQDGYFNQTNIHFSLCGACSTGCKTCTSISSTTCTSCFEKYYLGGSSCLACSSNCLTCTAIGCTTCDSISTLITGSCFLCTNLIKSGSTGCLSCVTNANLIKCTACADTYYLNGAGQCTLC